MYEDIQPRKFLVKLKPQQLLLSIKSSLVETLQEGEMNCEVVTDEIPNSVPV